jgi:hypothetical protein
MVLLNCRVLLFGQLGDQSSSLKKKLENIKYCIPLDIKQFYHYPKRKEIKKS